MSYLFYQVSFEKCQNSARERQDFSGIEKWDTSSVENMAGMFAWNQSFNQSIGDWDVSKVKDMSGMFEDAKKFNQSLEKWNVSNVENMSEMFYGAEAFNQNLDSWNIPTSKDKKIPQERMFKGTNMKQLPIWFKG